MTTTNTAVSAKPAQNQLFDLKQRQDGKWLVWVRKSPRELGMVDASIADDPETFITQPHLTDQSVWVIARVYDSRPSVETVLADLGVKRRAPVEGANKGPQKPRRAPAQPKKEALAA